VSYARKRGLVKLLISDTDGTRKKFSSYTAESIFLCIFKKSDFSAQDDLPDHVPPHLPPAGPPP
jgi:hypothetical protein